MCSRNPDILRIVGMPSNSSFFLCCLVCPRQRCWILLPVSKTKCFVYSFNLLFFSLFLVAVIWTKLFKFGPDRISSPPRSSIMSCLMWKRSVLYRLGCCLLRWQVLHPSWIIPRSLNPGTMSAGICVLWTPSSILRERDGSEGEEQSKGALSVLPEAECHLTAWITVLYSGNRVCS